MVAMLQGRAEKAGKVSRDQMIKVLEYFQEVEVHPVNFRETLKVIK